MSGGEPENNEERSIYNFFARQNNLPLLEYDTDEILTDDYIELTGRTIRDIRVSKENIRRWEQFVAEKDYRYSKYCECFQDPFFEKKENLPKKPKAVYYFMNRELNDV